MLNALSQPLFALSRGAYPEILVHGAYALKLHGQGYFGSLAFAFLARSLLSPWQYLACEVAGREDFWSLGLAFHSAQSIHTQALAELCQIARAGEDELICPREYPLDWEAAARLRLAREKPSRLHHPCSGKHMLMLAACERHGFRKEAYWETSHPMQRKVLSLVGREAGEEIQCVSDSCGLPSFVMPARVHLDMWERLAREDSSPAVALKQRWIEKPLLVGGQGRLDSDLTIAGRGRILAKEGADGLLMVQALPFGGEPIAGCLIKLAAGYHKGHLALALLTTIRRHPQLPSIFQELAGYLQGRIDEWLPRGLKLWEPPFGH